MFKKAAYCAIILSFLFLSTGTLFSQYNGKTIDKNLNATDRPDHIALTWAGNPLTTQTITWRAAAHVTEGSVSYYEAGKTEKDRIIKNARAELFETVPGDNRGSCSIFRATIGGLKPGTMYYYRVICGNNSSDRYSFATEAEHAGGFEFLVFGDSQSGSDRNPDYTQWHATVTGAFQRHRKAKFIVNMGDLVETGQHYVHWNNWFDAARDVITVVPEVPVQGNHETFGRTGRGNTTPLYFLKQFTVFQNGPDGLKGQVYSFDYGDVHFSILDSQQNEESPAHGDILTAQARWLDSDLSASGKKWKVVLFHKPPYSHHPFSINTNVKNAFCPVIEKHRVDLVLNAHDHVVARTKPMRNDSASRDPKEGTVYFTAGRSGAKYYNLLFSISTDAFFYNPNIEPCYESVSVSENKIQVITYRQDGSVVDSFLLEK